VASAKALAANSIILLELAIAKSRKAETPQPSLIIEAKIPS